MIVNFCFLDRCVRVYGGMLRGCCFNFKVCGNSLPCWFDLIYTSNCFGLEFLVCRGYLLVLNLEFVGFRFRALWFGFGLFAFWVLWVWVFTF